MLLPDTRMPDRGRRLASALLALVAIAGCSALAYRVWWDGTGTTSLPQERAVAIALDPLTPENQRKLACAALRRAAVEAVMALNVVSQCENSAGTEARASLEHIRNAIGGR